MLEQDNARQRHHEAHVHAKGAEEEHGPVIRVEQKQEREYRAGQGIVLQKMLGGQENQGSDHGVKGDQLHLQHDEVFRTQRAVDEKRYLPEGPRADVQIGNSFDQAGQVYAAMLRQIQRDPCVADRCVVTSQIPPDREEAQQVHGEEEQ